MEDGAARFGEYLTYERRYSPHTVKAYLTDLGEFQEYLESQCGVHDLMEADTKAIRSWISSLRQAGQSTVTLNRKISTLRGFYKWLLKTGQMDRSPAQGLRNLKKPRHLPEFVAEEQMNEILDNDDLFAGDKDGIRNRLIIELFYDTGIRETELINIRCCDVDEIMLCITVHGKGGKTRKVPITKDLCSRLAELKTGDKENFIFLTGKGNKMYPKLVYRIVHKYLEGTQGITRTGPHTLRHSFATSMLNNGAPLNAIKELLGHANLSATQIYTHTSYEKLKGTYNKAHPRA
ncbi:MAG: tyrosine-type recombinase/integrase [Bacteroidales bacterium]|nr:tyrosine-type recombinase/integrase [Bacteroidales bacterium]